MRALAADTIRANSLGNYGGFLLAHGRPGMAYVEQSLKHLEAAAPGIRDSLHVELAFYRYAHGSHDEQVAALVELPTLIQNGMRSAGWDLSANVERAASDGHHNPALVRDLAAVITAGADPSSLDTYEEWRNAT